MPGDGVLAHRVGAHVGDVERAHPVCLHVELYPVKDADVREVFRLGDLRPHLEALALEASCACSALGLGPSQVSREPHQQETSENDQGDRPPRHRDEDRQGGDHEAADRCLDRS